MGTGEILENKRQNKRERAKEKRTRGRVQEAVQTWLDKDWTVLVALIEETSVAGGAVRLGFTRDGGAIAIGMYMGDDYATEYIRGSEDFADAVASIAGAWLDDGGEKFMDRVIALRSAANPPR